MERATASPLIRYLRTVGATVDARERTDEELLQRFVAQRDETAFAVLVRRHGPLVLGVCRRLLIHEQDAEDAFQAVFLVLATKAATIRRRESLASFLHGVAERIARKARRTLGRRRDRAAPLPDLAAAETMPGFLRDELRLILDEEIRRLPRRYRDAFILCHLEGLTNAEAARRLGCPKGTVLSRLFRARERLARRLRLRDITLPASALFAMLSLESLRAAVPPGAYHRHEPARFLGGDGNRVFVRSRLHREDKTERIIPIPEISEKKNENDIRLELPSWLLTALDSFHWLTIGPKAREISPRFTIRLTKEDRWYSYLDLIPRQRRDKDWMRRARVVLNRDGYHVIQIWIKFNDDKEISVAFLDIQTNPQPPLTREAFWNGLRKGWKRLELPKDTKD